MDFKIISVLPEIAKGLPAFLCPKRELAKIKYTVTLSKEVLENCFYNSRSGKRINTIIEELQIQPQDWMTDGYFLFK